MPNIALAAAYIRVSTDDQAEYSPDAQRRALETWAKSNGYLLAPAHIYVDEGISGRKAERRPAFMEMIAQAKRKDKPFDAILVHKFDRFARSREDSVVYKSLLRKECGVKVISITESIEDDKFSVILEALLEAMAEYYSINLAEEVKKGMTEKHLRGEVQTTPAFGYLMEDGRLLPHPQEAPLVCDLFQRFANQGNYYALASWLNSLGVRTHRGNPFENRTVEYILRNPLYIGKLRWNPTGRSRRDYDNPGIVLVDGKHPPLIESQLWEAVQERVAQLKAQHKYHGRPLSEKKDWISGLVRCDACGATLVFTKPHYWKCNGYAHGSCRHSQHVGDDILKAAMITRLQRDTQQRVPIEFTVTHAPGSQSGELLADLQRQKEHTERKIKRLREAYLSGAESAEEYKALKDNLQTELDNVDLKLSVAQKKERPRNIAKMVKTDIITVLEVLHSPQATKEDKHNAVARIIDRCTWDKGQGLLTIVYRATLH